MDGKDEYAIMIEVIQCSECIYLLKQTIFIYFFMFMLLYMYMSKIF